MKTLYVIDNGGRYSSHAIFFVTCEPGDWGPNVDCLLLFRVGKDGRFWDPARVLLTSTSFELRDEESCQPIERYLAPETFLEFPQGMPGGTVQPAEGSYLLGRTRAERLVALWEKQTDHHRGWDGTKRVLGQPIFLEEFAALMRRGAFDA